MKLVICPNFNACKQVDCKHRVLHKLGSSESRCEDYCIYVNNNKYAGGCEHMSKLKYELLK